MSGLSDSATPGETRANPGRRYRLGRWSIGEASAHQTELAQSEALFTIGNGFIGIRGCFEEDIDEAGRRAEPATYLNGVYEEVPIRYHESAFGFPVTSDTRIPVADSTPIRILVGDEPATGDRVRVVDHARRLDLCTGLLTRRVRLQWASGMTLEASFERIALFAHPNLAAIRVRLEPVDFDGEIGIESSLRRYDPNVDAGAQEFDPRVGPHFRDDPWEDLERFADDAGQGLIQRARHSGFRVCALMTHVAPEGAVAETEEQPQRIIHRLCSRATAGSAVTFIKYLAYATDRGHLERDPLADCRAALALAVERGFDPLVAEQREFLDRFWDGALLELGGARELSTATRFGMFQLLQAAGRDGETSVSAKGQTGEGYEGHVFWDAESFALPMFAFTDPEVARSMLIYRHAGLEAARANARKMGHSSGALYPWRTIGGNECSSYFPAGSAQYHINADIAHAVALYVEATDDLDFLARFGAEMLVETARLWLDVGYFDPLRDGQFCVNRVTGPDEYSAVVDNNFYTNAMARENLSHALAALERLARERPEDHARLLRRVRLRDEEPQAWRDAADRTFLPFCEDRGIYLQDETFLHKKVWDFERTRADQYPLLLHFHPLTIYRHQVCKQADVVLALFLAGRSLDRDAMTRTYDYYKRITVHDSTLSPGIFSLVASRLGRPDEAIEFFRRTALIDVDNLHRNSDHGLHMAAMASAWMAVAFGFGGLDLDGGLGFAPIAVPELEHYRFRVCYRGRCIEVTVDGERAGYRLIRGRPLELRHAGRRFRLDTEQVQPLG